MQLHDREQAQGQQRQHDPAHERDRLGAQHALQQRQVHREHVDRERSGDADDEQGVVAQRDRKCRARLRTGVERVHVLHQHHQQQQRVARLLDRHLELQQQREGAEAERRHPGSGEQSALDHEAVEERIVRAPRRRAELVAAPALEGERHILDAVGDEIQPQQLHRQQRDRQPDHDRQADREHFGGPGRGEQVDDVADVLVSDTAFLDAGDDRGEVVVAEHEVGRLARDIGAAAAHGHADVGAAQRRCVVDAVAGHGDEMPGALGGFDQRELLLRGHPREHASVRDGLGQCVRRVRLQRAAVDHVLRPRSDAQLARDRQRRCRMIPGHHHDADAGGRAATHRVTHFRPQRIDQADEAGKLQIVWFRGRLLRSDTARRHAAGEREHAQPALRHLFGRLQDAFCRCIRAHLQHALGCALDGNPRCPVERMPARGEAPFGLVGNLVDLRSLDQQPLAADATLLREREQCDVGRIAAPGPAGVATMQVGLVAGGGDVERAAQTGAGGADDFAHGRVARTGDGVATVVRQPDLARGQLVAGERAGLVAGDQRAAAQTLDGRQAAHDRAACGHAARGDGQRDRQRDRQALGDCRHRQRDGEDEHGREVVSMHPHADRADERRGDQHDDRDRAAKALHALDQGRLAALRVAHCGRQPADRGRRARGDDHAQPAAARDQRPGVGHGGALGERRSRGTHRGGVLEHRQRLAGQRSLRDLQAVRAEQAQVRRHQLPAFECDDVAGHQLGCIEFDPLAVAQRARADAQQFLQALALPFGAPFLPAADHGVHQQDDADEGGIRHVAECERHDGGGEQHVDERALELPQADRQPARRRLGGKNVRPAFGEALLRLRARQAVGRRCGAGKCFARRQCVPGRRRAARIEERSACVVHTGVAGYCATSTTPLGVTG